MDRILTFIKDFNVPRGDAGPEAPAGGLRACAAARRKYRTARAKTRRPGAPGRQSQRRRVDHRRAAARSNQDSEDNGARSEEHTSELQSRVDLVCRHLL